MGCKIGDRKIQFEVRDDGEVCEVVHTFRPMTSSEEMELMREIAAREGLSIADQNEHYRTCTDRWWGLLIVCVEGYEIAPAYDMEGDGWKAYIPHEHKLEAMSENSLKKAHVERPVPPSSANSETTSGTSAPEPEPVSSSCSPRPPVTDAATPGPDEQGA